MTGTDVRFEISVDDTEAPPSEHRPGHVGFTGLSVNDESPPLSPARAERRPLRVEFVGMEDLEKNDHRADVEKDLRRLHRKGTSSSRYAQPRMSLLGKPLNYRIHKRDARYRRIQAKIYNFLERPKDWRAISYHLLV